jgi:hypothetical protein
MNVDIIKTAIDYLPPQLRTDRNAQYIASILKPLVDVNNLIEERKNIAKRDVGHWGSKILLEHYINKYSLATDYVYIANGSVSIDPLYIFSTQDVEEDPTWFFFDEADLASAGGQQIYLESIVDIGGENYNFSVLMSENDYNNRDILANVDYLVNKYKVVSFSHKILIY